MKRIRNFIVLMLIIFSNYELSAQMKYPNIPSPTAINLGLYGEIPVSHYTGVPNISIPLYNIQSGDINVPITLNYHTSSLYVGADSGLTGLGWTLSAGGVITRTVKGNCQDEATSDNGNGGVIAGMPNGYLNYTNILKEDNWKLYIKNLLEKNGGKYCNTIGGNLSLSDFEPDEFSFNFGINIEYYTN